MRQIILTFSIISFLFSCGDSRSTKVKDEHGSTESHAAEDHVEHQSSIVSLTEEQIKTASIEMGTIETKNLHSSIRANGTLTVPNQNKALITSLSSGVLRTLLIQPGSRVQKGQTVATLVNADAARLQKELQTTNAQINMAEIELQRQKELVEGNAAPLKNMQRVQTELATLTATRNALQKQLVTIGISPASVSKGNIITTIPIKAPIAGTVSNVNAQIGSPVDASTPIAEIVNNSQLHLDLFVYEKDLPKLNVNQVIHFTLTNNPGKEYDAKIFSIGTAFISETKTIPIHAVVLGDKAGLIEGMNITALISIGEKVVPAVPTDAIVSQQGQDYIFVQTEVPAAPPNEHAEKGHVQGETHQHEKNDQGHEDHHEEKPSRYFERVQVVRGASDIGYTEITLLKSIAPKTPIVAKGAFFLMAKMSNTGGHEH